MNKILLLGVLSVVLLLSIVTVSITPADAIKSKGTSLPETNSGKVCGDRIGSCPQGQAISDYLASLDAPQDQKIVLSQAEVESLVDYIAYLVDIVSENVTPADESAMQQGISNYMTRGTTTMKDTSDSTRTKIEDYERTKIDDTAREKTGFITEEYGLKSRLLSSIESRSSYSSHGVSIGSKVASNLVDYADRGDKTRDAANYVDRRIDTARPSIDKATSFGDKRGSSDNAPDVMYNFNLSNFIKEITKATLVKDKPPACSVETFKRDDGTTGLQTVCYHSSGDCFKTVTNHDTGKTTCDNEDNFGGGGDNDKDPDWEDGSGEGDGSNDRPAQERACDNIFDYCVDYSNDAMDRCSEEEGNSNLDYPSEACRNVAWDTEERCLDETFGPLCDALLYD